MYMRKKFGIFILGLIMVTDDIPHLMKVEHIPLKRLDQGEKLVWYNDPR
jgi:hypothetical protein